MRQTDELGRGKKEGTFWAPCIHVRGAHKLSAVCDGCALFLLIKPSLAKLYVKPTVKYYVRDYVRKSALSL